MQIFVKTLAGRIISLSVDPFDTIESVKAKRHDENGIPPKRWCLTLAGKELPCHITLSGCNVQRDATLQIKENVGGSSDVSVSDASIHRDDMQPQASPFSEYAVFLVTLTQATVKEAIKTEWAMGLQLNEASIPSDIRLVVAPSMSNLVCVHQVTCPIMDQIGIRRGDILLDRRAITSRGTFGWHCLSVSEIEKTIAASTNTATLSFFIARKKILAASLDGVIVQDTMSLVGPTIPNHDVYIVKLTAASVKEAETSEFTLARHSNNPVEVLNREWAIGLQLHVQTDIPIEIREVVDPQLANVAYVQKVASTILKNVGIRQGDMLLERTEPTSDSTNRISWQCLGVSDFQRKTVFTANGLTFHIARRKSGAKHSVMGGSPSTSMTAAPVERASTIVVTRPVPAVTCPIQSVRVDKETTILNKYDVYRICILKHKGISLKLGLSILLSAPATPEEKEALSASDVSRVTLINDLRFATAGLLPGDVLVKGTPGTPDRSRSTPTSLHCCWNVLSGSELTALIAASISEESLQLFVVRTVQSCGETSPIATNSTLPIAVGALEHKRGASPLDVNDTRCAKRPKLPYIGSGSAPMIMAELCRDERYFTPSLPCQNAKASVDATKPAPSHSISSPDGTTRRISTSPTVEIHAIDEPCSPDAAVSANCSVAYDHIVHLVLPENILLHEDCVKVVGDIKKVQNEANSALKSITMFLQAEEPMDGPSDTFEPQLYSMYNPVMYPKLSAPPLKPMDAAFWTKLGTFMDSVRTQSDALRLAKRQLLTELACRQNCSMSFKSPIRMKLTLSTLD